MKTKFLLILLTLGVILTTSCKKTDSSVTKKGQITSTQLDSVSENASTLFSKIQDFMFNALSIAADSGLVINQPPSSAKTNGSKTVLNLKSGDNWFGPDANGWYSKTWTSLTYTYTEKIKCKGDTLVHILDIEYSGGDASYSNVTTTQYIKYIKNKQVLWQGYTDWEIKAFGNNNISDVEWKFEFTDWDPQTGAGTYNWYWGANSLGGDPVPYHRFLNIIATENNSLFVTQGQTLHVKVTWYDGSIEVGSFEYDTDWKPVEMPDMPCGDQNNGLGF